MYDFLKALFGTTPDGKPEALTFDQLSEKLSASKDIKLANLSDGGYVSKEKHDAIVGAKETELNGVRQQLTDANAAIQSYKSMDIDGIKQSAAEWEQKYQTDTAALTKRLADQERTHQEDLFFAGYKFSSKAAAAGVRSEFSKKNFPLQDGKFAGAKEWMDGLVKDADYSAAFAPAEPPAGGDKKKPSFTDPNPKPSVHKGKVGLAALMQRKNDNPDAQINFDE